MLCNRLRKGHLNWFNWSLRFGLRKSMKTKPGGCCKRMLRFFRNNLTVGILWAISEVGERHKCDKNWKSIFKLFSWTWKVTWFWQAWLTNAFYFYGNSTSASFTTTFSSYITNRPLILGLQLLHNLVVVGSPTQMYEQRRHFPHSRLGPYQYECEQLI